jgi:hypothetical protein
LRLRRAGFFVAINSLEKDSVLFCREGPFDDLFFEYKATKETKILK